MWPHVLVLLGPARFNLQYRKEGVEETEGDEDRTGREPREWYSLRSLGQCTDSNGKSP